MSKSSSRLKVFQSITDEFSSDLYSRTLEIRSISNLPHLLNTLYSLGGVQTNDCSTFLLGFIRVTYYDIRDAKTAFAVTTSKYSVKFVKSTEEDDFVILPKEDYFFLMPLLWKCGEISQVDKFEDSFLVHFYDNRAARASSCLLSTFQSQHLFRPIPNT